MFFSETEFLNKNKRRHIDLGANPKIIDFTGVSGIIVVIVTCCTAYDLLQKVS